MKRIVLSFVRILLISYCTLWLFSNANGQGAQVLKHLRISFSPTRNCPENLLAQSPVYGNRRFLLLKTDKSITEQAIVEIQSAGIVLGGSIAPGVYIASLPLNFPTAQLETIGFQEVAPFHQSLRIDAELQNSSARQSTSTFREYYALAMPGMKVAELYENWNSNWGKVKSLWEGELSRFTINANSEQLTNLLNAGWVQWVEPSEGDIIHLNGVSSSSGRTNCIKVSGAGILTGLDGKGVTIAVGDGGMVESHGDLDNHQENLVSTKVVSFGNHQDHVTGTVAGSGLLYADKEGMAPGANILNTSTSSVISTGADLRVKRNVLLTNNSYGLTLTCNRAGIYNSTCSFIDDQLSKYPDLLHVFAAGNQGNINCGTYPIGYRTISEGYPVSKNVLTVGAVLEQDQLAWFSSSGPAMDGRVKPEIVADGNNVVSTVPYDAYDVKGGTSQAAPMVTGTLALLIQRYRQLNGGSNPESALLKGLVCNTADDLGLANVDFTYGYGRINARKAKLVLDNNGYKSGTVKSHESNVESMVVPANALGVKIMLAWADPAGVVGTTKALVNNLDLKVLNGAGQTFLPWVMNSTPSGVGLASTRKVDTLNNMEQVTLNVTPGENLEVMVSSGMLAGVNQKYWLVYQWVYPELVMTQPLEGQLRKSGTKMPVRWDLSGMTLTSMKLETSLDSGVTWSQAIAIANPLSLYGEYTVPVADFQKRWFRLSGVSNGVTVTSSWVKTLVSVQPVVTVQACNQTLKLNWTYASGVSKYEVMVLNREMGRWDTKGFATTGTYFLNQLDNGKLTIVSVKPWKNGLSGLRSDAVKGTPVAGTCSWTPDLGIVSLESPKSGRRLTGSDPGTNATVQVKIQNFGNVSLTNQAVRINMSTPDGTVSFSDITVTLATQASVVVTLPSTLSMPSTGAYPVKFWTTYESDINKGNDTLSATVNVYGNPAVGFPWQYQAENLGAPGTNFLQTTTKADLNTSFGMDFNTTNGGRLLTELATRPSYFGAKCIVLDKKKIDGTTGTGELIFTLNLAGNAPGSPLYLDFDWLPLGSMTAGNSIFIRPNDQSSWIEVVNFFTSSYVVGTVKNYRMINLIPLMGGQGLSSSFQIRFTQSGTKPSTVSSGNGYAIDNLLISMPGKDFSMKRLVTPVNECHDNLVRKVKVKIQNRSLLAATNMKVGYLLSGQAPVEETIASVSAADSIDYEFSAPIPFNSVGKLDLKVWISLAADGYPGNDTLRNQLVFISPNISSLPYSEGFETTDGNWRAYGTNTSWQWGTPSKTMSVIDTAANGTRIWTTGMSGLYANKQVSYLESPCFNMSTQPGDIQFSFNSNFSTEQDYDYAWLEMSVDGIVWSKIGAKDSGTNWYNHASNNWNGIRDPWVVTSIRVAKARFGNNTNVRFRYGFSSDASINSEGFGLDDVQIEPAFNIVNDTLFSQTQPEVTGNSWTHFGNLPNMVASVEKKNIGPVLLEMKRHTGAIRTAWGVPYLNRSFHIHPNTQPSGKVKVRLYITDAEVQQLAAADPTIHSFQELGVYKYDGSFQDLSIDNNDDIAGNHEFIPASKVQKTPTSGGYFLEFQVSGFSEFYIAGQSLAGPDEPLGISLTDFTAGKKPHENDVEVNWTTESEVNTDRFVLSYSTDGKNYETLLVVKGEGEPGIGYEYSFRHNPKATSASVFRYRLQQFDNGSEKPAVFYANCNNDGAGKIQIWVTNPMVDNLEIHNLSGETDLKLYDSGGREVLHTKATDPELKLPVGSLPNGRYQLQAITDSERKTIPVIKVW
ncbi:MAG TPA: S8 family serine peptidase [Catalimonadaceae bacterium]|nr:S8 family serine peptidase [Catalimonadaceae bacterium]